MFPAFAPDVRYAAASRACFLGSLFPPGQSTVTCTATDAAGNTSECVFTITVADLTPPERVPQPL